MSDTLTTYHGDPKVKASLLRRISAHEKADRLTQGTYGSMNGHWRGCAVSCSLATRNGTFNGEQVTDGLHAEYPKQLGHTDGGRLVMELYGHPSETRARERLKRAFQTNVADLSVVKERKASNG